MVLMGPCPVWLLQWLVIDVDSFDRFMSFVVTLVALIGPCSLIGCFCWWLALVIVDGIDGVMSLVVTLVACHCRQC